MPDFDDDPRLAHAFAALRREVAPYVTPPGSAAARLSVRHRRRVAAAAIATSAALLVGGPAVGFAAADNDTPTPPPVVVTQTPTPAHTAPATPTPTTPTSTKAPGVPRVAGKVFYMTLDGKLYLDGRGYPGDYLSLNVSPNGKKVTWVEDGNLMMSDVDGSHRRTVHRGVENMCDEPVWSGDSTRLLITQVLPRGANLAVLYLAGGAGDDLGEPEGCHYRWSADGSRLAYQHGDTRGVTIQDLDGGDKVTLTPANIGGRRPAGLLGISADGGRVCIQTAPANGTTGDAARGLTCDTLVDVRSKKVVDLPAEGTLRSVVFLADGGMLARLRTDRGSELVRLDKHDRVIARSLESAANADRMLLAYTPN
ncbi:hypothetical protein AB0J74_07020 [Asanoa sp. NPDC049573]|uniref:TolB family protein n=1 Tax=Asanoa sp. NPDC049573 TaxID=3155396 RepID=UPI00343B5693